MRLYSLLIFAICILFQQAQARAVFAHFMVSNTEGYPISEWEYHMNLALDAHIDAFALNIANGETTNLISLERAFQAAENVGFQLFFSFDYAGNGAWAKADVINLIKTYSGSAYWYYNDQPLCSTFEGPDNAADWIDIKKETNCFFIPDWSSLGADEAMQQADGVADGLFSWAAWPYGPADMDTYIDASYQQFLDGKPYMMPVSPWFFTNMPGYDKNWLWRGDDLWYDRWQQVFWLAPEFVEIISWNDYGESHYIGPIYDVLADLADTTYVAFDEDYGDAPYNYVAKYDHSGWRALLPFLIDTYKNNYTTITEEGLTAWYRLNAAGACSSDGGTTGNTVSQLQLEYWPYEIPQDKIFYDVLLGSTANITVSVGGVKLDATWDHTPSGGAGIYHGSVSFTGHSGDIAIEVTRSGETIFAWGGESIVDGCSNSLGIENWNAYTGYSMSLDTISVETSSFAEYVCIDGWGKGNFDGLCEFTCAYGYCPVGACVCSKMGPQPTMPTATGVIGYPIAGESASYSGLCSFACNYGYCPDTACGTVEVALTVPTVSPFTPDTCTAGSGTDSFIGLCSYSCNVGYCPIHNCTCTETGPLNEPATADTSIIGISNVGGDSGLCDFACERGYCPTPTCTDGILIVSDSSGSSTVDDLPCINLVPGQNTTAELKKYLTLGISYIDEYIATSKNLSYWDIEMTQTVSISDCNSFPLASACDAIAPLDCTTGGIDQGLYWAQFFIHNFYANLVQWYDAFHTSFSTSTLNIDQIVEAFDPTIDISGFDSAVSAFTTAFGEASTFIQSIPGYDQLNTATTIVTTITSLLNEGTSTIPDTDTVEQILTNTMESLFTRITNLIVNLDYEIFQDPTNSSYLPTDLISGPYTYAVSNFLYHSQSYFEISGEIWNEARAKMNSTLEQWMVGQTMASADYYILKNGQTLDECDDVSSYQINGSCYQIAYPGRPLCKIGFGLSSTVDNSTIQNIEDYDIDVKDLITVSEYCQNQTGQYYGKGSGSDLKLESHGFQVT
ncbi:carbohydrate-binding module family 24 protein [Penicillium taxi]|uniref:carbohydrate-binding module family 24 protein n=1 Tax=Penicillium taxi TaxID=168475 RepID=UPI002544E48F|nr:carbohydrate-binding module family 24 protein [Penicillium taxi]KAJ5907801.1 carbohydrate-binding module family 24 protein [Penicillium taxi]